MSTVGPIPARIEYIFDLLRPLVSVAVALML